MLSGSTRHHIIDLVVIELRGSEKLTVSNWGVLSEWWVHHSMWPENQVWYSNSEQNMLAQTSVTHATTKMKIFTFNIRCCSQITAPFGDAYKKIGTIQRRLGWPLHKDDTLFQSGKPMGLHIYFSLVFLGSASHSLSTYMFCNGLAPFVRLGPLRTLKSTKYQRQTQRRQCYGERRTRCCTSQYTVMRWLRWTRIGMELCKLVN